MVVVLPAPLGPSRQNTWLRSMANQLPLIAQNSPARFRPRRLEQQKLRGGQGGEGGRGVTEERRRWAGRQAGGVAPGEAPNYEWHAGCR